MHVFLTLLNTYRWKHGAAEAEDLLRRLASDRLILMTTGASDGLWPTAIATRVDGGYRVTGRKTFCSVAPVADLLFTFAAFDDPHDGRIVLGMGIPCASPGFRVVEIWNALGMRGTGSYDVQLDEVLVTESQITGKRPWGQLDPIQRNALIHFALPVAAVYYGLAAAARDQAVHAVSRRMGPDGQTLAADVLIQRSVGEMDAHLKMSWWALLGALDELGHGFDYPLDDERLSISMLAKRSAVLAARAVVDLAMQAVGGAAYFKRAPIERIYRDVRAGAFHSMSPEKTLLFAGRLALEQHDDQTI